MGSTTFRMIVPGIHRAWNELNSFAIVVRNQVNLLIFYDGLIFDRKGRELDPSSRFRWSGPIRYNAGAREKRCLTTTFLLRECFSYLTREDVSMSETSNVNRRGVIKQFFVGTSILLMGSKVRAQTRAVKNDRIKQCVTRGGWNKYSWDDFCKKCVELGLHGVDLVGPDGWPHLKKYGLIATMVPGAGSIVYGLNQIENHDKLAEDFKKNIKAAADNGWPNVITFSGSRWGMSDEEAHENCHLLIKKVIRMAEDRNVTICMELLNSKIDHPGYVCDNTKWGAEMVRRVDSPNFKLLYDIYHMQIMEGDVIRTIRRNIDCLAHFHTAGNPGRKDLDDDQELNYRGIMRAIAKLTEEGKFHGYVAHEFGAKHDWESLRQAVELCDV
ncbi:MAG: TIM barrel protein [bacterium]|nr:TIM barrel protein [bacterium]